MRRQTTKWVVIIARKHLLNPSSNAMTFTRHYYLSIHRKKKHYIIGKLKIYLIIPYPSTTGYRSPLEHVTPSSTVRVSSTVFRHAWPLAFRLMVCPLIFKVSTLPARDETSNERGSRRQDEKKPIRIMKLKDVHFKIQNRLLEYWGWLPSLAEYMNCSLFPRKVF